MGGGVGGARDPDCRTRGWMSSVAFCDDGVLALNRVSMGDG